MKKYLIPAALFLAPAVALAQSLTGMLTTVGNLINQATPIVIALALLYFFWGLANYILHADDPEKKEEGRNIMIWGVIALFIMVSVWGIIRLVQNSFSIQTGTVPFIPTVPTR